ncbi:MAG: phosphotransferase [Magnetospirillum sp. WYHS-4]
MGIITRLYHRSDGLSDNKYNVFFMDMGENIHIHYRDLRIELSAGEFLEFADLCEKYIPQVRKEIAGGYRDGIHPNTNQSNTLKTISENKALKRNIAYNPKRISLEENTDGYHVHIRNYKILLDKASFLNFARAAKEALEIREKPIGLEETLGLIEVNDLVHRVDETSRGDREQARVTVDKAFFRKTIQLLEGLGYRKAGDVAGEAAYEKADARILLRVGMVPAIAARTAVPSPVVPLVEFLDTNGPRLTPREINLLKLQILDFFEYVRKDDLKDVVDLDHRNLLYDTEKDKVIFPTKDRRSPSDVDQEWSRFYNFLHARNLGFVKPRKVYYSDDELKRLDATFRAYVAEKLAKHPCVAKIYLLNPMETKKTGSGTGRYEVPFVHINWVKLGSDFDILVEMDERHPVPADWTFKFHWSVCGSDYYHLGEVDFPIPSPYVEKYPNTPFHQHLVEAYLFFPSRGNLRVKDSYLAKFPHEVLYERPEKEDGATAKRLRSFVEECYGMSVTAVEPLRVFSFNKVFTVKSKDGDFVAKIMKGVQFTPATEGHPGQHVDYEAALLHGLAGKDLPVVIPRASKSGALYEDFDKRHCMLFPFVELGDKTPIPGGRTAAAARTLAQLHKALADIDAPKDAYRFGEALDFWLKDFLSLPVKYTADPAEQGRFEALAPIVKDAQARILKTRGLPWLHCHGDVCPRNYFFTGGKAILYDFQAAHYGPRIEDLAEGALEFAQLGPAIDQARVDAFVASYEAESSLTPLERQSLPTMLLLHAALKLGRLLRMEVVFGNKVDKKRIAAFLDYAEKMGDELRKAPRISVSPPILRKASVNIALRKAP